MMEETVTEKFKVYVSICLYRLRKTTKSLLRSKEFLNQLNNYLLMN
jgi:hypothetical protein